MSYTLWLSTMILFLPSCRTVSATTRFGSSQRTRTRCLLRVTPSTRIHKRISPLRSPTRVIKSSRWPPVPQGSSVVVQLRAAYAAAPSPITPDVAPAGSPGSLCSLRTGRLGPLAFLRRGRCGQHGSGLLSPIRFPLCFSCAWPGALASTAAQLFGDFSRWAVRLFFGWMDDLASGYLCCQADICCFFWYSCNPHCRGLSGYRTSAPRITGAAFHLRHFIVGSFVL